MIKDDFLSGIFYSVPNLRFPNFCTPWKIIPISNLLQFQNGINGSPEQYGKGVKFISVGDILNNIYITYDNIKGLIDIDEKTLNNYSVTYGDILFQRSSEIINDIGRTNVYLDKNNIATFGGFVIRGKRIGQYNPVFFNYLLKSPSSRKSIIRLGAGAQHYNIGQENIKTLNFCFPDEIEQAKIACLFSKIDERIQIQIKIIKDLKMQRDHLIHSVFSSMNSKLLLITDIAEVYQPQTISSEKFDEGAEFPVFGANGIIGHYEKYNHENEQICIACRGSSVGTINISKKKSWITGNSMVINSDNYDDMIDKKFLYYQLMFIDFYKYISGSGQPQITRESLKNLKIKVPSLAIQHSISNFLNHIDLKITIEAELLCQYQLQKSYLLKNMFI